MFKLNLKQLTRVHANKILTPVLKPPDIFPMKRNLLVSLLQLSSTK